MGRTGRRHRMARFNRAMSVLNDSEESDGVRDNNMSALGRDEIAACEQSSSRASLCERGGFTGAVGCGVGRAVCATTVGLPRMPHRDTATFVHDGIFDPPGGDMAAPVFDVQLEYASVSCSFTPPALHLTLLRPPFSGVCSSEP